MSMYQSEKNLLEKLADAIPGLKGYRDKEERRDTDKRLREFIAGRIDAVRKNLEDVKRKMATKGLDGLDQADRLSQRLFKASNSIRHASYGYSGFFDQVKIQEAELDRIYQHDLSLIASVESLEKSVVPSRAFEEAKEEWEQLIQSLEKGIEDRKNLFSMSE
jgi:hypothetical protein